MVSWMLNCDCCKTGLSWQPWYSGACSCTVCQHTRSSGSCYLPCACSCPTVAWPLKIWPAASRSSALQKKGLSLRCITQGLLCLPARPALHACFLHTPCCMHRLCIVRASKKSSWEFVPPHMPVRKMFLWHVLLHCCRTLQACHFTVCACHLQHHNHGRRCSYYNTGHVHVQCCRLILRKQGAALFTARRKFTQASLTSHLTGQQLQLHGSCQRGWMKLLKKAAAPS